MAGKKPKYRLVKFHDDSGKNRTEVGAIWESERGLSIEIKEGLAVAGRLFAFPIEEDEQRASSGRADTSNYRRRDR